MYSITDTNSNSNCNIANLDFFLGSKLKKKERLNQAVCDSASVKKPEADTFYFSFALVEKSKKSASLFFQISHKPISPCSHTQLHTHD